MHRKQRTLYLRHLFQTGTCAEIPDRCVGQVALLEHVKYQTVQDVAQAKRFNPKVSASLGPYADGDIFDRLQRIRDGAKSGATRSPKLSEFDTFASGRPEIGANYPVAALCDPPILIDCMNPTIPVCAIPDRMFCLPYLPPSNSLQCAGNGVCCGH
jgi:hypothetical protein